MKLEGLADAKKNLEELDRKAQRSIVRKGLRIGAKVLLAASRAEAPERSGFMKSKIKVRTGKSGKGRTSITIGVGAKDFKGEAFYGAFVLYGHKVGPRRLGDKRKVVPANNFLERAFDAQAEEAVETTVNAWKDLIEAESK